MVDQDILKKLKEMGITDSGKWKSGKDVNVELPFAASQKEMLKNIQNLLENQLTKDMESVDYFREVLKRLERGGGS